MRPADIRIHAKNAGISYMIAEHTSCIARAVNICTTTELANIPRIQLFIATCIHVYVWRPLGGNTSIGNNVLNILNLKTVKKMLTREPKCLLLNLNGSHSN